MNGWQTLDTLNGLLEASARRKPDAWISWAGETRRTYSDFLHASRCCATALGSLGVKKGDRIAFWAPNSDAYLDLFLGAIQIGAIAVPVNTRYGAAEAGAALGHTRPGVLVMDPGFHGIAFEDILSAIDAGQLTSIHTILVCGEHGLSGSVLPSVQRVNHPWALSHSPSFVQPLADDECAIFTTSGTTSGPKYAVHTHGSIARHARDVSRAFHYDDPDAVLLHTLPFCGIFGFSQLSATIAAGASSVFFPLFDAESCRRTIQAYQVTHTSGTDDLLKRILISAKEDRPFPSLRECVYAGFNPALARFPEEAERRGMALIGCFGMSEIHSFFSRQEGSLPVEKRKIPGGRPVSDHVRVRARNTDTGQIAPHGEIGELEIFSKDLFSYYFEQPAATQKAFTEDGFFRSGDFGRTFADGTFEFLGRRGDFMRLGGFMVNPREIEETLQALDAVETAIVVDAPHVNGTRAVAFVKLAPHKSWDVPGMLSHCRKNLANFKVPSIFVQVDDFPITMGANGEKIQRNKLKTQASALLSE